MRHSSGIRQLWTWSRRRLAQERGQVLVIVALALPVVLAMSAFAIDMASMWVARHQAQAAADAGALAGAQDLVNGTTVAGATVTTDAQTIVDKNDPNTSRTVTTPYNGNANAVKVTVTKQVPLRFGNVFGIGSGTVTASAVATANLNTPLQYFGSGGTDLTDGSTTSDQWDNFCAQDGKSNSTGIDPKTPNSDDPQRCPADSNPENYSIDGWTVVHGGVDLATAGQFTTPPSGDPMVDLTGTCVEAVGNFPSAAGWQSPNYTQIKVNGITTYDDGYCENNSDGELTEAIPTIAGDVYTVTFWLGANTWGYPYEKSMMVIASKSDLTEIPAIADTNGGDNSSGNPAYGTSYPLESSSYWTNGTIIAHEEYFEWVDHNAVSDTATTDGKIPDCQSGNLDGCVPWTQMQFQFTAVTSQTWLGFGALTNCVPDWYSSSMNNDKFYTGGSNAIAGTATYSGATPYYPPAEVHADNQNPWQDQCKYGPGLSDIVVTGPNSVSLTQ